MVNKTATSLLLQYHPPKGHGGHAGYSIYYNGSSNATSTVTSYIRNFTLKDGLVFNVTCLQPFSSYQFYITPLEVPSKVLAPVLLEESTLESGKVHLILKFINEIYTKIFEMLQFGDSDVKIV